MKSVRKLAPSSWEIGVAERVGEVAVCSECGQLLSKEERHGMDMVSRRRESCSGVFK